MPPSLPEPTWEQARALRRAARHLARGEAGLVPALGALIDAGFSARDAGRIVAALRAGAGCTS